MKILITGASGFIGSYLVEHALEKNWEVTAAVRRTSDKTYLQDKRLRFLELNFGNEQELREKLQAAGTFDYVIHNAGATKVLKEADYFYTNTGHTERFVRALSHNPPKKFLYVSSMAAMGPADFDSVIHANDTPRPIPGGYGGSKLAAENFLKKSCPFPYSVVQPTGVYGPRDKDLLTVFKIIAKGMDVQTGMKPQKISLIHAQDLTEAMYLVLERGENGSKYMITDGANYMTNEFSDAIKKALNKKAVTLPVPVFLLNIVAGVSEKLAAWQKKTTLINPEKMRYYTSNWHTETPKIFSELNFKPKFNLNDGVKQTADWYKKEKWI